MESLTKTRKDYKPIPGYDGDYEVNSLGTIVSYRRKNPSVMKHSLNSSGQYSVNLRTSDNKTVKEYIAKLVFELFCELPEGYSKEDFVVVHKDGDRTNFDCNNLEAVSRSAHIKEVLTGRDVSSAVSSKEELPNNAVILTPTIYQLNAIRKRNTVSISPKVTVLKAPNLFIKDGKRYKEVDEVSYVYLLKEGNYNMDRVADMLDNEYSKYRFEMLKSEDLYAKDGGETYYKSLKCRNAFVLRLRSHESAAINSIKESILDLMEEDTEVETESILWMYWNGKYRKVTINLYEESSISPVDYRGSLTIKLRREDLPLYVKEYIYSKADGGENAWYNIPCGILLMHEQFGIPRPSQKHTLSYMDFNFLNLTEHNLVWETYKERDKRIHEKFPLIAARRSKSSRESIYKGLPSDKVKSLVERHYFIENKSVRDVAKMISSVSKDDYYPRVRHYLNTIKEGKVRPVNSDVIELIDAMKEE